MVLFTRTVSVGTVVLYFVHISVLSSFPMLLKVLFIVVTITYEGITLLLSYFPILKIKNTDNSKGIFSFVQEYFDVRNSVIIY